MLFKCKILHLYCLNLNVFLNKKDFFIIIIIIKNKKKIILKVLSIIIKVNIIKI